MRALLLLSVLIATFAIPVWLVRRGGSAGYGDVLKPFAVFVAVYVFLLLFLYPRLP